MSRQDRISRLRWTAGIYAVGFAFAVLAAVNFPGPIGSIIFMGVAVLFLVAAISFFLAGVGTMQPEEKSRLDLLDRVPRDDVDS
jgi:hypothetical protein